MSITNFIVNLDFPSNIFQGDNFDCELTVNAVLLNYKCRVSVYDKDGNDIQLATANVTGGADTQVLISSGTSSTIKIFVDKDLTDNFKEDSYIEVEIEDTNEKVYTILKYNFKILKEDITWTDPS